MTCAPATVRTPAAALRPQLSWLVNLSFLTLESATFSKYVCLSLPHEGCTTGLCYDMHCQYARIAPVFLRFHGHQTRPGSSLRHRIDPHQSVSLRVTVHAHYFVLFLVPLYPRAPLPTTLGHLYIHKHLYSPALLPAASAFRRFPVSRGDLSLHRPHPSRSHGGLWEDCKGICHPSLHTTQVSPTSARRQRSGCANRKSSCWDPSAGRCTPFHYIYLDLAGGIITVEAPAGCPGCD